MKLYLKLFWAFVRLNTYLLFRGMWKLEVESVLYDEKNRITVIASADHWSLTSEDGCLVSSMVIRHVFYPEVLRNVEYHVTMTGPLCRTA